jgi:hypothetical protein
MTSARILAEAEVRSGSDMPEREARRRLRKSDLTDPVVLIE